MILFLVFSVFLSVLLLSALLTSTAANPTPSLHLLVGLNFLFRNFEIRQCHSTRHSLDFPIIISVLRRYSALKIKNGL